MGCFYDLLGGLLFALVHARVGQLFAFLFFFASLLVPIRGKNIMNKRIHHLNFNCVVRFVEDSSSSNCQISFNKFFEVTLCCSLQCLSYLLKISTAPPVACPCSCIDGAWDAYPPSTLAGLFKRLLESPLTLLGPELSMLNLLRPTRSASESRHPLYANAMHVTHISKSIHIIV